MLEPTTLALLARLKTFAKQAGVNIDLVKMCEDMEYAKRMLQELSNADNPELVLVVVNLMNYFGMIKAPSAKVEEKVATGRYIGTLR
ncbi:MAG: hypothetical protein WAO71_05020 [Gallionella sp.]